MHRPIATLAALALCAALLAACTGRGSASSNGSSSSAAVPNSGSTSQATPPASSSGTGTADSAASSGAASGSATAYSAAGLNTVLTGLLDDQTGAAGSSLRTAAAAGELVNFAVTSGTASATLGADAKAWLDTLTDAQKEALRANWSGVREMAHNIATDLDAQTGLLTDAGVRYDFAHMDMGGVDAFVNTLDSVLGAY